MNGLSFKSVLCYFSETFDEYICDLQEVSGRLSVSREPFSLFDHSV